MGAAPSLLPARLPITSGDLTTLLRFGLKALTIAAVCRLALCAQARSFDGIRKDGKIIVATEGQFAPFNYFQGSKLTGFEIDVAEAMVAKMGLKVEWKALSFDALLGPACAKTVGTW